MSRDAGASGRSVLAQLTAGVPLPLPALPSHVLAIIVGGIYGVWTKVPSEQAQNADESALNAMLETQLNNRPDLSITLTDGIRARDFPFTIECKLLDKAAGKTFYLYCKEGVKRLCLMSRMTHGSYRT